MGLLALPPEVKNSIEKLDDVREDIKAVRRLLERLVEIEELREHRGHVHVTTNVLPANGIQKGGSGSD